jgi:hypothetical protein
VEVAAVDDDAADGAPVVDLDRLDPEVAGEAARQERPHVLGRETGTALGWRRLAHRGVNLLHRGFAEDFGSARPM